jgi:prepilin peptidase CpaA
MWLWNSFVLAFVVTVAVADARWRMIPRNLTVLAFFTGLLYHAIRGGFLSSLLTAAAAFAIGLGLYELRAIGGGDVKLMTALGAMLGFQAWLQAVEIGLIIAGLMALIGILRRRVFLQTLRNIGRLLQHFFTQGLRPHPDIQVNNPSLVRIPFGVAAAVGTVFTVVLG